jgi:hypothetical protein
LFPLEVERFDRFQSSKFSLNLIKYIWWYFRFFNLCLWKISFQWNFEVFWIWKMEQIETKNTSNRTPYLFKCFFSSKYLRTFSLPIVSPYFNVQNSHTKNFVCWNGYTTYKAKNKHPSKLTLVRFDSGWSLWLSPIQCSF